MSSIDRLNTALEGRYAIERELGEGGMATVYLAEDIKHDRKVALKVLKPELAAVVGAERFLAEIKTTANLQHPHILPLFDSGEADGFLFYVMPHVEGESLRERLDREKQLGVEDSIVITQKVAGALDYAHGHGVVHRDIKPGNILLSAQGEPLVADFGIALAVAQAGGGRITETGLSLGTPHYMSPEQATGDRDVDPRSDVYAIGCVLYEMLAGQPPFSASTAQAVLVRILTTDAPSITSERRTVPPHVGHALARALEKLPADRFTTAAEFGAALADPSFTYEARQRTGIAAPASGTATAAPEAAARPWLRDRRSLAALAAIVVIALWGMLRGGAPAAAPAVPFRTALTDFEFNAPGGSGNRVAISSDGSQIALASFVDGVSMIFVCDAGQRDFREIPGTEGGNHPGFSPDGQWLVFEADNGISRVEVSGGPILPVVEGRYPHWGLNDIMVFQGPNDGLYWVAPSGGDPVLILDGVGGTRSHVLPDGRAVVFQGESDGGRGLMLVEIGSGEVTDLGVTGDNPMYVPTGHLVFGHQSQALMAVPFDLETHRVTGQPSTVLPDVLVYGGGATQFAVSETGTAVYALSGTAGSAGVELVVVDLEGRGSASPLGAGPYYMPRFSPSGRYIAYTAGNRIWVWDRESGANPPITTGENTDYSFWSRDGRYVYFSRAIAGTDGRDGFRTLADGSGEAEQLFRRQGLQILLAESLDGTQLLVREATDDRDDDLLILTLGPDSAVFTNYLVAPWSEAFGTISPDGGRVAYVSNESGISEVYVRSFPEPTGQLQVSDDGGADPVWAPDGSAVYYLDGGAVWRAELGDAGVGERRMLFVGSWATRPAGAPVTNWDVHPDGTSFVFVGSVGAEPGDVGAGRPDIPVEVVVNWFEELRERVGN